MPPRGRADPPPGEETALPADDVHPGDAPVLPLEQPDFVADPYPYYAAMRRRGAVHYLPEHDAWWVLSHAGATQVLSDRRFRKRAPAAEATRTGPVGRAAPTGGGGGSPPPAGPSAAGAAPQRQRPVVADALPVGGSTLGLAALPPSMLFLDPPDHTRLRSLVNRAFTPTVVERLRPRIEAIATGLLDAMAGGGEVDLVATYAFPLPAAVIAELLGVPPEDQERFRRWSEAIALSLDVTQPAEAHAAGAAAQRALAEYFAGLLAERRREPRPDLLSALLVVEEQGDRLAPGETLAMCGLLLVAGHETTKNLIANGTLTLLRHPEALAALREDPGLLPSAVEELLRFESPVQRTLRLPHEDVEVDGTRLPAGARVVAMIGAANRDPAVFAEPERLDLGRRDNPHLAFGRGIHFCLGAPLARLEGAVALQALLRRFPRLRLATDRPAWSPNTLIRSLSALPVGGV